MNHKKRMAAPAQGYLRQVDAARFCGTSVDTVARAAKLYRATGGRFGLKSAQRGRLVSYAVADLIAWVELGMPTGFHREEIEREDGTKVSVIRQVAFA